MNSSIFVAMLCIGLIVLAAIVALVYLLTRPAKTKPKQAQNVSATTPQKPPKRNWQTWILYVGIALIFTYWTIWGALFFLAVVWVLGINPGSATSYTLTNNEKSTARRVYTWLFFSPLITVPIFIGIAANLSYTATTNERVLAALVPLIVHIFLLLGLTSKSAFVYRHTQQGLLLIALRAGLASLAALNVENHIDYALLLFFFGNGSLWLIGSIVGWSQTSNGKCWFMDRKGEKIILSEAPAPNSKELVEILKSSDTKGVSPDREQALQAFRTGTPEMKKIAVVVLARLGEVEKF